MYEKKKKKGSLRKKVEKIQYSVLFVFCKI